MSMPMIEPGTPTEQRREVEDLVRDLPRRPDRLAFEEPWEVRAFALAVAAHASGHFAWSDFQHALIASITRWEQSVCDVDDSSWSYYEHWVNAIEAVLARRGAVDTTELDTRTRRVLNAPANRNHHEPHLKPVAIDPAVRS